MVGRGRVLLGMGIVFTFAAVGGVVRTAGMPSAERAIAGDWGTAAFVLVIAAPAVLAAIGTHDRPWVLLAAGVLLLPLCFLSFSFLFFPLVIPAVLFVADAAARPRPVPRSPVQCVGALLSALFVVAAVLSLFAHADPVSWSTRTGAGSASDVITAREALTAYAFVGAAFAVAALTPRDGTPA